MFDRPFPYGFNHNNSLYHYMAQQQQSYFSYIIQYQQFNYNFYGHPGASPKVNNQLALPQPAITDLQPFSNVTIGADNPSDAETMDLHAEKPNHDYENCAECRQAVTYLLTPPSLEEIYPEAYECSLNSYSLFDQNLKLFENPHVQKLIEIKNVGFNFAPKKRFSTGFQANSLDESFIIGEINYSANNNNDVTSCCDTTSEFDDFWLEKDLTISQFTPKVNSTLIGKKLDDSTGKTPWKKAIVFDPSLSPPYNNAFPSLDSTGKKIQEKRVARIGNGHFMRNDESSKLCVFCRNNAEPPEHFLSHLVKDPRTGKTTCPVLRKYRCIFCNAIGDNAHTRSYCPKKIFSDMKRTAMAYRNKNNFN